MRSPRVGFKLYLITDHKLAGGRGLAAVCEAALQAADATEPECPIAIQLRDKELDARELLKAALELRRLCDRYRARLLINDRLDIAIAARADGVHLPADSFSATQARALLGPAALIGRSTHQGAEVAEALREGADFVVFGPVYQPFSKGGYGDPRGVAGLKAACRSAPIPVFALGGITPERVREIAATGAAGVAVIGAVMGAEAPGLATKALLDALAGWPAAHG